MTTELLTRRIIAVPGARISDGQAQIAGERFVELKEERGELTAEAVIEDAQPEDSPIHPFFEWDDCAAAEKYRREQARHLLRSVAIIIERPNGAPSLVRLFHARRGPDEGEARTRYVTVFEAQEDATDGAAILEEARRDFLQLLHKYRMLGVALRGVVQDALEELELEG
jgi:hypothetical protein